MGNRAVAYIRVSTEKQAEPGLGAQRQRDEIKAWAAKNGVEILSWHEDLGVPLDAKIEKCPALVAALGQIEAGTDLVVSNVDRLGRDTLRALTIENMVKQVGARVVFVELEELNQDSRSPLANLHRALAEQLAKATP